MKVIMVINLLCQIVAILCVTTVFEFTKALTSFLQGDLLPKNQGSLTINPIKHFEPIGFIMFLFLGYGWGKPVNTSALYYEDRKKGTIITYATPMVISLLLGVLINMALRFMPYILVPSLLLKYLSIYFVNIAVFNLLPVHPMSGSKILSCFLGPTAAIKYIQNEKIIQTLFLLLMLTGMLTNTLNMVTGIFL